MGALALIGFGSFVLASLWVGLRLLLLARRTRRAPELSIGLALFVGGGLGYLLIMLAFALRALPPAWTPWGLIAGFACTAFGAGALAFGVRRIYRPDDAWADGLAAAISVLLAVTIAGRLLDPTRIPATSWIFWLSTLASGATYAWCGIESLRYHAMLRRRARIGLADAAMARRFLLWGVSAIAALGIHLTSMLNRVLFADGMSSAVLATNSLLGLVAAVGIWLAFFPPRRAANPAPLPTP